MIDPEGKRKNSLFAWLMLGFCLLILAAVAYLPTFFSQGFGKESLISFINQRISGTLFVEKLKLSWLSGQQINNLILLDSKGNEVLKVDNLTTDKTLLPILLKTNHWGNTTLNGFFLHVINEGNGQLNLEEALGPKKRETKSSLKFSIPTKGELLLENGLIKIDGPKISPITLSNVRLNFKGDIYQHTSLFQLSANSITGLSKGDILLSGRLFCCKPLRLDLEGGWIKALQKMSPISFSTKIEAFPVAILDQLLAYENLKYTGIFENALGPTFSATGEFISTKNDLNIDLNITSQNLKAQISGNTTDKFFQLDPQSQISLTLTPLFFDKLVQNLPSHWRLGEKSEILLHFENLSFPLPLKKEGITFKMQGSIDKALISEEGIGPVTLRNIQLSASSLGLNNDFFLQYKGDLQTTDSTSQIEGKVVGSKLLDKAGRFNLSKANLEFSLKLASIPLDILNLFLNKDVNFSTYLGRSVGVISSGNIINGVGEFEATIQSSLLQTEPLHFKLDQGLHLLQDAKLTYRLAGELLKRWLPSESDLRVTEGGVINASIHSFNVPANEDGEWVWENMNLNADFTLGSTNIMGITHFSPLHIEKEQGKITLNTFKDVVTQINGTFGFPSSNEYAALLIGPDCSFDFSSKGTIETNEGLSPLTFSAVQLKTTCNRFLIDIQGKLDESGLFQLTRPGISSLTITPESFNNWAKVSNPRPATLTSEGKIDTEIAYFSCKLFPFDPRTLSAKSHLSSPLLALCDENIKGCASLSDLNSDCLIDGEKDELLISLQGKTEVNLGTAQNGRIDAEISLKQFFKEGKIAFGTADLSSKVEMSNFPVFLLNAFLAPGEGLPRDFLLNMLGPTLNISSNIAHSPQKEPHTLIQLAAEGVGLKADLGLSVDGTLRVTQNHPARIDWIMTPLRYQMLMALFNAKNLPFHFDYILEKETALSLVINELHCPTLPIEKSESFLCQSGFTGDFKSSPMAFRDPKTGEQFEIQHLNASIQGKNFSTAIKLTIACDFLEQAPVQESGALSFNGELLNAWTKAGAWNKAGLTLKGDLKVNHLPVRPLLSAATVTPRRKRERLLLC